MTGVLYVIHIIVAVLLIIVILLQRGKGTELGAAFGGASGAPSAPAGTQPAPSGEQPAGAEK